MSRFHNTVRAAGRQLAHYESAATTQELAVLAYFEQRPAAELTPEDIQRAVLPKSPLTSARRAITNLTTEGRLVKLAKQRRGQYGYPVHCWRLAAPQGRLL